MPVLGLFKRSWRSLRRLRLGLLMMKVPLPRYSALYNFSLVSFDKTRLLMVGISLSLPQHWMARWDGPALTWVSEEKEPARGPDSSRPFPGPNRIRGGRSGGRRTARGRMGQRRRLQRPGMAITSASAVGRGASELLRRGSAFRQTAGRPVSSLRLFKCQAPNPGSGSRRV